MSLAKLTHTEWQEQVIGLGRALGWQHLHVRRTRGRGGHWTTSTNVKGWPDLWLWNERTPGWAGIELKVRPDLPTQDQLDVLASLQRAGALVAVAYPEQWDQLVAMLQHRVTFPPYEGRVRV